MFSLPGITPVAVENFKGTKIYLYMHETPMALSHDIATKQRAVGEDGAVASLAVDVAGGIAPPT